MKFGRLFQVLAIKLLCVKPNLHRILMSIYMTHYCSVPLVHLMHWYYWNRCIFSRQPKLAMLRSVSDCQTNHSKSVSAVPVQLNKWHDTVKLRYNGLS